MRLFACSMTPGSYRGLQMLTTRGVHEEVERLVAERFPSDQRAHARVLDIAAGRGALTQRLVDAGFTNVTAWDLHPEDIVVKEARVERVDLNAPFADRAEAPFDLVVAVEVIEHLENPYAFLRELSTVLAPTGTLVLTTPNVESALSRLKFFRKGEFRWFAEEEYQSWGHIQPITAWQLDKALRGAGLEIAERSYNLRDVLFVVDGRLKSMVGSIAALLVRPLMTGNAKGEINVWVITRQPPR
jgi:SAM-dependent methyltransferase